MCGKNVSSSDGRCNLAGITPACAGKTTFLTKIVMLAQDHTRVCGKNVPNINLSAAIEGSPSRVREKHERYLTNRDLSGITPACAGKTGQSSYRPLCQQDHTRVCGKNGEARMTKLKLLGSHPRVREKLLTFFKAPTDTRITPACAGKTLLPTER